ncbi:MAG: transporter substrate-binding domain-containing protein, partial [Erysipelotrichaceae bacterium]|nr:transporter substrate-binding domain-containing protein [Erysipelotrichaceae bacterium]
KGKTTANSSGSTYAALAEEYGATVNYIDTFGETITLLLQGRIDATINSEVSYLDYMSQHPDTAIKIVSSSEGEAVCYPANLGEVEFIEAVNNALQELRDSGQLAELSIRFFGGDITNK